MYQDSREGWSMAEQMAYECEYEAYLDKCEDEDEDEYEYEYEEEHDGQPDEYTEWQDYYGGDDWDFGQFDNEY